MNYILVLIATILLAFDFSISKKYQIIMGTSFPSGLFYNALNGLCTAFIFWGLCGFRAEFSLYSVIMAFLMSLFAMLYSLIGFQILKAGNMALYSLFLMSGGMLLPYLFGTLFLNEYLSIFRIVGVVLILAAIVLSNRGSFSLSGLQILFCVLIFVLNGLVSIISKCHQINTVYETVDSTAFVMYSGIGRFLLSTLALFFCKPEENSDTPQTSQSSPSEKPWRSTMRTALSFRIPLVLIVCSALIGGVSYMLQLIGAKELPATVLYPMVTGGSIIFSAVCGRLFFKEKITTIQLLSILLCFVGTCLFL